MKRRRTKRFNIVNYNYNTNLINNYNIEKKNKTKCSKDGKEEERELLMIQISSSLATILLQQHREINIIVPCTATISFVPQSWVWWWERSLLDEEEGGSYRGPRS